MRAKGDAVLVVEDDFDLLDMMKTLLEGAGYRVLTASEGGEAVARGAPLTDLPGFPGGAAAERPRHKSSCMGITGANLWITRLVCG